MKLITSRFGSISCNAEDTIVFPSGIIGFEDLQLWTLLADERITWLQSVEDTGVSLPAADPFEFVPQYEIEIGSEDRDALAIQAGERPIVLCIVNRRDESWTMNLRAPLVIRREARMARQVITLGEQPLRYVLSGARVTLGKCA